MDPSASLLIVDDAGLLEPLLRDEVAARGCRTAAVDSLEAALRALEEDEFDAVVTDLGAGPETSLDAIREVKRAAPDTEIVVISSTRSIASAIKSYELEAFALVQKPFDIGQLLSTVERALERRRMKLYNRRLVWELQTINEIAQGISRSLDLDEMLSGALQEIVRAFDAVGGAIRLRDEVTGLYGLERFVGPPQLRELWDVAIAEGRPTDAVVAGHTSLVVEDLADLVPPDVAKALPVRSAVTVPMLAGGDVLGSLSVGASRPGRFHVADERLLAMIAGQIVVAVQNARLHHSISRGKREWEQTFDAISEPIAVFDSYGVLLRGNTALATLLGRRITDLRAFKCQDVGFCGGGCPSCAVGLAATRAEVTRAEVTLPGGQIFSVITCPAGGGPEGASVVQFAKNVTEEIRSSRRLLQMSDELAMANAQLMATVDRLKSTQAQLLQAEKLSAIGQLVAGVAHELNNPLTSVIGYAQLLEAELLDGGAARPSAQLAQDLRRIAEESERAARIVRNLLAFARRQAAARAPHDVADLVGRVLTLRNYALRLNAIDLVTEFAPGLPQVMADESQLQQALLNLILNAEQAMRGRPARRLTVGARFDQTAAAVELYVADTGHGIDLANLSRIFDPFFTTRDVGEGTGLGLSICYGIVRDHGGQISVESRVQGGTTFSILLPALVEQECEPARAVLVAHGDQGERDFMAAALRAWGYTVVTAQRGDEATDRYRQGGLLAVLVDRGVLGDAAAWRDVRKAVHARVPMILLAATADSGDLDAFAREQANAILTPPFQLKTLRAAIRAVVKEKECV